MHQVKSQRRKWLSYERIYEYCCMRNNVHFILYHCCCRYLLEMSGGKSGNLIMSGEWPFR